MTDPHPAAAPDAGEQCDRAEVLARQLHWGQKELDGGDYIKHVERVVALVQTDDEKTVAWLHDLLEDTPTTANDLVRAGFSDAIVEAVKLLSRDPLDSYADYIDTIHGMGNLVPLAKAVKIADLRDHLRPNCPERLRPRYERALKLLTALPAHQERTEPTDLKIRQLEWVLARAEEIVRYEHGKDAAYSFTQAWGELPSELTAPARAAEWQPLRDAAVKLLYEKLAKHQAWRDDWREPERFRACADIAVEDFKAVIIALADVLPPCALTGNSK